MKLFWVELLLIIIGLIYFSTPAAAAPAWGIHLLDPNEIHQAAALIQGNPDQLGAVTVVLRTDDRDATKWQGFLNAAAYYHTLPIIRLATALQDSVWRRPTRKDIVDHASFLTQLDWRQPLTIILFNEPNHAAEWGGQVDSQSYADLTAFAADWFHTEPKTYQVLPAGLDAAAPTAAQTLDNLTFLNQVRLHRPDWLDKFDGWTAHAYPNPGFAASVYDSGKNSLRSFEYELAWLNRFSSKNWPVYITETGWKTTPTTINRLSSYYRYAVNRIWSDPAIKAVTPFIFSASTGPFQEFSFTNPDGSPTPSYAAFWQARS